MYLPSFQTSNSDDKSEGIVAGDRVISFAVVESMYLCEASGDQSSFVLN